MKFPSTFHEYNRSTYLLFFFGLLLGIVTVRFFTVHDGVANTKAKFCDLSKLQAVRVHNDSGQLSVKNATAYAMVRKVRVFGMILTMPVNKKTKAVHVKATWARRLDGFVFISSEEDKSLPSIRAVGSEARNVLWDKMRQALFYVYNNSLNDYDFFFKADDDTYVIVENIRLLLSKYDPEKPILMGRRFKKFAVQGYASGGAGYVLSRSALKLIVAGMRNGVEACRSSESAEDVRMGQCAEAVNVKLVDSLDEHGQEVFHPFRPSYMLDKRIMDATSWVHSYNYFPIQEGLNCCSDHSVSFHYMFPKDMYIMEFLVYHLHPFGIVRDVEQYRKFMESQRIEANKL